jgi:hypothetical protein
MINSTSLNEAHYLCPASIEEANHHCFLANVLGNLE